MNSHTLKNNFPRAALIMCFSFHSPVLTFFSVVWHIEAINFNHFAHNFLSLVKRKNRILNCFCSYILWLMLFLLYNLTASFLTRVQEKLAIKLQEKILFLWFLTLGLKYKPHNSQFFACLQRFSENTCFIIIYSKYNIISKCRHYTVDM